MAIWRENKISLRVHVKRNWMLPSADQSCCSNKPGQALPVTSLRDARPRRPGVWAQPWCTVQVMHSLQVHYWPCTLLYGLDATVGHTLYVHCVGHAVYVQCSICQTLYGLATNFLDTLISACAKQLYAASRFQIACSFRSNTAQYGWFYHEVP